MAYRIGRAFAQHLKAKRVVIGGDNRLTSERLKKAVSRGLMDAGANVIDLGMTGTEEVYFAAFHLDVDGGIEITASHNPRNYNGMKFVGRGAKPISGDNELASIKALAESQDFTPSPKRGTLTHRSLLRAYRDHLLGYITLEKLVPLKLVVNAGNGAAGHVIDAIEAQFLSNNIPIEFIKIHHRPNGKFPHGIPNPLLPENRHATSQAVKEHGADMGIAWDGDFDRCFFFDEHGDFIEGYYIVGLLAGAFLQQHPGETIIHDPRLTWNTIDIVNTAGGVPVPSKTGHSFIKQCMRDQNAIYGGEMSAHHYFRDFAYCDSGMIPWLLLIELMSNTGNSLAQLVQERIAAFPCSGELNFKVANVKKAIKQVRNYYAVEEQSWYTDGQEVPYLDDIDGLTITFSDWRLNLRASNTEPLLRLNVEAKKDYQLVRKHVEEIEHIIGK
ncbi:MAG: phosphomannomutase CpsG [Rhizobiales bacterium]|nr:phosphomannomutase CpsG [Hyphomicrobiales bacterium]